MVMVAERYGQYTNGNQKIHRAFVAEMDRAGSVEIRLVCYYSLSTLVRCVDLQRDTWRAWKIQ